MRSIRHALRQREMEFGPLHAETDGRWRHWRLARDGAGIAWLLIDRADASANTLSDEVLRELDEVLAEMEAAPAAGLVIRSAKHAGFIAGADVTAFHGVSDADAIRTRMAEAHRVVDRLEALTVPTIAVIHGYCLGGGLEIALACDYRIAISGATLGFPEVMLGLHPGLGGTARSTRLIDPTEAMTMMLTGKPAHAAKAKALGLVDAVVEERHVANAVRSAIAGSLKESGQGLKDTALNTAPARRIAAARMRSKTAEKAPKDHYPAPYRLIDLWEEHGGDPAAMKAAELRSFSDLLVTDTAQHLIRAFLLRERLKKNAGDAAAIRHVHVIGAGSMGGDIAGWCALHGLTVTLADPAADAIGSALRRADELAAKRHLKGFEARAMLDRLIPDPRGQGVAHADLVIEAVPEKIEIKRDLYRELEPRMKAGAILATNTSSIPLDELRAGLEHPGRLVGLHFFNPVARMQLVEVVRHDQASDATVAAAAALVGRIDRLPVEVTSAPGFLVNRALTPYLLEAMAMLDEGIDKERIDRAATTFGMPMGPVELADRVGLDICLQVGEMLRARLDRPLAPVPDWLRAKVDNGELGLKSDQGFYRWSDGKPERSHDGDRPTADGSIADRLILPLIDACVACLREGVATDADSIDAALIFGTGFAPFRGGPLHYARTRGKDEILAELERLAGIHGDRFRPDPGWRQPSLLF